MLSNGGKFEPVDSCDGFYTCMGSLLKRNTQRKQLCVKLQAQVLKV